MSSEETSGGEDCPPEEYIYLFLKCWICLDKEVRLFNLISIVVLFGLFKRCSSGCSDTSQWS